MITVVPQFPPELGAAQQALVDRLVASNRSERMTEWQRLMESWQAALAGQRPA